MARLSDNTAMVNPKFRLWESNPDYTMNLPEKKIILHVIWVSHIFQDCVATLDISQLHFLKKKL